jgi:hypothetical protein
LVSKGPVAVASLVVMQRACQFCPARRSRGDLAAAAEAGGNGLPAGGKILPVLPVGMGVGARKQ